MVTDSYGRKPHEIAAAVPIWLSFLYPRDGSLVREAFREYLKRKTRFPAPADILEILEPTPKLCPRYYAELKKKQKDAKNSYLTGVYLYGNEQEYIDAYELQEQKKIALFKS